MTRTTVVVSTTLAAVIALAGCSSATTNASSGSPSSSATSDTPSASPTSGPTVTPTGATGKSGATSAPTPGALVSRSGGLPASQRVSASPAPVHSPVVYPDGLQVRVTGISQKTVTAQGPGELTGKPLTVFTIEMTNGTSAPIDLTQVVVTAAYGSPAVAAPPVYDNGIQDFATNLKPGATATTKYAFSIPVKNLKRITLSVDFDGKHTAAVFDGSATS
jgi:hypothetical protein